MLLIFFFWSAAILWILSLRKINFMGFKFHFFWEIAFEIIKSESEKIEAFLIFCIIESKASTFYDKAVNDQNLL